MTEKQKKWSQIEKIMYIKSVTFKGWFKCYSFISHSTSEFISVYYIVLSSSGEYVAKLLILFGLLFMACGEVGGGEPFSSGSSGELSSGSRPSSSSRVSSSSLCTPLDMELYLQHAPENSYVHGPTQITMDDFYISAYLITQGQYKTVMGASPSRGARGDTLPVDGVSWFKAVEFCKKLSAQMCLDSNAIKLPTEAQWEYVAYQGTIIQREPDYWEWTNDCYDSQFPWTNHDPSGPPNCLPNAFKVRKGLNNYFDERFSTSPDYDGDISTYISFRVAVKSNYWPALIF
jgi:hypothetical protein